MSKAKNNTFNLNIQPFDSSPSTVDFFELLEDFHSLNNCSEKELVALFKTDFKYSGASATILFRFTAKCPEQKIIRNQN